MRIFRRSVQRFAAEKAIKASVKSVFPIPKEREPLYTA